SVCTAEQLSSALETVRSVQVSDATIRYIIDIVAATRQTKHLKLGASPRASQALYRMSQAWAILNGRNYAIPDDVQQLAPYILPHRLITNQRNNVMEILGEILANVPVVQSIQKN
ncbi:MAG: AAA family ATPase, partial [Candidatus Bruticola sp.]